MPGAALQLSLFWKIRMSKNNNNNKQQQQQQQNKTFTKIVPIKQQVIHDGNMAKLSA